jgi:DNA primase
MAFTEEQRKEARERIPLNELIGRDVALKQRGREFVGLCPFHNEKTPSFHVVPEKGFMHCFGCGTHGDAIAYVMQKRGLSFVDAMNELLNLPVTAPQAKHQAAPARDPKEDEQDGIDAARRIWTDSVPLDGTTQADLYLRSRMIAGASPSPSLRAHASLRCRDLDKNLPALVAALKDSENHVTAIQRTWLEPGAYYVGGAHGAGDPKGTRLKEAPKKTLGSMRNGCVRLSAPDRIMGFAEGVETARAAEILFRVPVWATCGLSRLGYPAHLRETRPAPGEPARTWFGGERPPHGIETARVPEREPSIWIPPEAEELLIFGDRGVLGERVADYAAWAYGQFIQASAIFPESEDWSDFADQLRAQTLGAIA